MEKQKDDKCRITTPEFRVSFPHVFKPTAMPGTNNAPKYSIVMLFDKTHDLTILKTAIFNAKLAAFGSKENFPAGIKNPYSDGDAEENAKRDGYAGHWVFKATSNEGQQPTVVDGKLQPIIRESDFYAGCYAKAYVYARVWEFPKGSKKYGVQLILDHVQKTRDGKAFSGRKAVEDVFTPIDDGASGAEPLEQDEIGF